MRKSLNDSLREEFNNILSETDYREYISLKKLNPDIIKGAFEKLLSGNPLADHDEEIERSRGEFENYIINTLKSKDY